MYFGLIFYLLSSMFYVSPFSTSVSFLTMELLTYIRISGSERINLIANIFC